MRTSLVALVSVSVSIFALVACGAPPAPEAPPAPTTTPTAVPSAAPVAIAPTAAPAMPSAAPSAAPVAPPAAPPAEHVAATLKGKLLGKPFNVTGACVIGPSLTKGHVVIELYDVKDFDVKTSCAVLPGTVVGARKLGLIIPWKAGEKLDIATLKSSKDAPEGYVMEVVGAKKFARHDVGTDWKPKGSVEIVRAAVNKGDVGRIRFDVTIGADKLAGEVDVDVINALEMP
jgi:hypothetical protein